MLFTPAVLLANEGLFARLVAHILFNAAVYVGLAGNNAHMSCHSSQGWQNSTVSFNNFQGAIHVVSYSLNGQMGFPSGASNDMPYF